MMDPFYVWTDRYICAYIAKDVKLDVTAVGLGKRCARDCLLQALSKVRMTKRQTPMRKSLFRQSLFRLGLGQFPCS
jgi:hypothetical protein